MNASSNGVAEAARQPAAAAAVTGLHAVTVFVTDVERALRFYIDVLGLERRESERVEVAPPGSPVSLMLVQPTLSELGVERASIARQRIGEPTGLVLETDDIESVYGRLRARGVDVASVSARDEDGRSTVFRDPDGNELTLVQTDR